MNVINDKSRDDVFNIIYKNTTSNRNLKKDPDNMIILTIVEGNTTYDFKVEKQPY